MSDFQLVDEDYCVISTTIDIIRLLLKSSKITPKKIIGLGNALYALERLPEETPGVNCEFSIVYTVGKENSEMVYINFRICETDFQISKGGSVYDANVGGDSYTDFDWIIESSGYRDTEYDLCYLEDMVMEYLNLGAEINVDDESDIQYE